MELRWESISTYRFSATLLCRGGERVLWKMQKKRVEGNSSARMKNEIEVLLLRSPQSICVAKLKSYTMIGLLVTLLIEFRLPNFSLRIQAALTQTSFFPSPTWLIAFTILWLFITFPLSFFDIGIVKQSFSMFISWKAICAIAKHATLMLAKWNRTRNEKIAREKRFFSLSTQFFIYTSHEWNCTTESSSVAGAMTVNIWCSLGCLTIWEKLNNCRVSPADMWT